jgi:monoterpene epsilon-lactone hydrolase
MASIQAHAATWIIKHRLKPRLTHARDMDEIRQLLTTPPIRMPRDIRISAGEAGGVPGEWVEGPGTPHATLLYLHGGGYFACSAETHRPITVAYAQQGFRVFAPDYRLAPEHPFPAALEDALAVYRALLAEGHPPLVSGESAGGGLALATLLSLRTDGIALPAAAALFSPWTDLAATGASLCTNDRRCAMFFGADIAKAALRYVGAGDPRNPLISPLYGDLTGLPPLLIHVGSDEVLLDDSTRLAERARAAGVPVELKIWPVVPHAWQLAYPQVPEARQSLHEAGEFLKAALESARAKGSAA